jgi:hypothetical protein
MNSGAQSKLAAILELREKDKIAASIEQQAREVATAEREAHLQAIRQRWALTKQQISTAVESVNAEIASTGMTLSWSEKARGYEHAGLAQLFITLKEEGFAKERQVVLNVSALGLVPPVTLIPHTGRKIPDFKIDEVSAEHYTGVIIDFIEQCFAKKPE